MISILRIQPKGIIKGGMIHAIYDVQSEIFKVHGNIKIGVFMVTKNIEFDEYKKIQIKYLKSDFYQKGHEEKIENITFSVLNRNENYAIVAFHDESGNTGSTEVQVTQKMISFNRISVKSSYVGQNVIVEAIKI